MDNPIAKKEHFAEISVKQALEAGAHYIDADDVRDLIGEYERALESNRNWGSSLRSQLDHNVTVNGMAIKSCNALRDSNNELKQQLAEARLALDSSEKLAAQFEQESTRLFALTNKQAHLLTQTGMALRCYEQEPVTTSELHDLPGRAAALRSQLDCALHAIEKR